MYMKDQKLQIQRKNGTYKFILNGNVVKTDNDVSNIKDALRVFKEDVQLLIDICNSYHFEDIIMWGINRYEYETWKKRYLDNIFTYLV